MMSEREGTCLPLLAVSGQCAGDPGGGTGMICKSVKSSFTCGLEWDIILWIETVFETLRLEGLFLMQEGADELCNLLET